MRNEGVLYRRALQRRGLGQGSVGYQLGGSSNSRKAILGLILVIALLAFEIFNFDTTRYALRYLLGEAGFGGFHWATILAIAFCAIDLAGLARLFTPEEGVNEPHAVWYLMGAWLLGTTMNALMTWWAVTLTLLTQDFGNEVLSRQALLQAVPIFVASLVWLTRILFIGALSVTGGHLIQATMENGRSRPTSNQHRQEMPASSPWKPRSGWHSDAVKLASSRPRRAAPTNAPGSNLRIMRQHPSASRRVYRAPARAQARARHG